MTQLNQPLQSEFEYKRGMQPNPEFNPIMYALLHQSKLLVVKSQKSDNFNQDMIQSLNTARPPFGVARAKCTFTLSSAVHS